MAGQSCSRYDQHHVRKTLLAFAAHGNPGRLLPADEGYAEAVIAEFTREGINDEALAAQLQREGTTAFAQLWSDLLRRISAKDHLLIEQ